MGRRPAKLAYVTPAHQFPVGVSMSLPRRVALLEWAHRTGALIVEDDYDSEFRYIGRPYRHCRASIGMARCSSPAASAKCCFPRCGSATSSCRPDLVDRVVGAEIGGEPVCRRCSNRPRFATSSSRATSPPRPADAGDLR